MFLRSRNAAFSALVKLSCRIWAPILDTASLCSVQSAVLVFARFWASALPASNVRSRLFMYSRSMPNFRGAVFPATSTRGPSCGYTLFLWSLARRRVWCGRDCRSSLYKETYVLQLIERRFRRGKTGSLVPAVTKYACILTPALLWHSYVHFTFGSPRFGTNFGWPFSGCAYCHPRSNKNVVS